MGGVIWILLQLEAVIAFSKIRQVKIYIKKTKTKVYKMKYKKKQQREANIYVR